MQASVFPSSTNDSSLDAPTYTPTYYVWVTVGLLAISVICFAFGIKPGSLTGIREANALGWMIGAVVAPITSIVFRQHDQIMGKNPSHIRNSGTLTWVTWYLVLSVCLSVAHAAFFALERTF